MKYFTAYILLLIFRAWYRLLYDSGDFGAGNNMWRWLPGIGISKKNVKLFYFEFEIFWGVESELEKVSQKILNDLIIKRCSFGRFAFYWGQKFGNTKYRADCPHIGFCTLPSNYHWVYWSPHGSTWYKWYKNKISNRPWIRGKFPQLYQCCAGRSKAQLEAFWNDVVFDLGQDKRLQQINSRMVQMILCQAIERFDHWITYSQIFFTQL